MIEIDLNDTVSVELTEWGAAYLNATNIFKEITTTQKWHYKTDYKAGDVYKSQLWELILEFKDGIRFDKEKAFNKLKKVIDKELEQDKRYVFGDMIIAAGIDANSNPILKISTDAGNVVVMPSSDNKIIVKSTVDK